MKPRNWRKRYGVKLTSAVRRPMSAEQLAAQREAYKYKMLCGVGDEFIPHTLCGKANGVLLRAKFNL